MEKKYIFLSSLAVCALLYFVEQIMMVDYLTKTLTKVLLFTLVPILYIKFIKKKSLREALNLKKMDINNFKLGLLFGVVSFLIVFGAFLILRNYIDLNSIASELQSKSKITPGNFIFVGLYITIGNSFLEEFFFRGYIFLNLYEQGYKKTAYVFSAVLFGLYHIAIFKTWFNIELILLALSGLIGVAIIFNWLNTKSNNFINSWIVHILADSAIILIGMRMFNLI
ncbi:CAAX amino terminal protease [Fervidicella metallireducens AeB]|uniref:CAAX amino terminal protease n=1 Tax=Fervidicella metallireducens AeB TaxID=1403537 RepID=A0A017RV39_9CLOT|nr:CPBP family intramembrane glutamic endopeptidase [Fervidicella metallireducens]EYE88618.1 CAAX amino terminal protease [Fervidicella metallireducens AeB]